MKVIDLVSSSSCTACTAPVQLPKAVTRDRRLLNKMKQREPRTVAIHTGSPAAFSQHVDTFTAPSAGIEQLLIGFEASSTKHHPASQGTPSAKVPLVLGH